jgi:hypothetical protein
MYLHNNCPRIQPAPCQRINGFTPSDQSFGKNAIKKRGLIGAGRKPATILNEIACMKGDCGQFCHEEEAAKFAAVF